MPDRDFFVSYTGVDRPWAEWISWVLEEDGYAVLMQAWDFVPGTNWVRSMQEGVTRTDRTIAVLSAAYLESTYGTAEWQAAWAADPSGTDRKLLTVRVADCDRPGLLGSVVGIDLFGRTEAQARTTLRTAVAQAVTGRAKPDARPPYPVSGQAIPEPVRFPGTPPLVWNLPAPNPNFTGRDAELQAIAAELFAKATVTVHSLHGLGGIGKTQLAIEYAHTHAGSYDVVWSIAAEVPAAIPDQFAALARALGIEPGTNPDEIRGQVHEALRHTAGWLLIFDNAGSPDDIRPWLPGISGVRGHVIGTTRRGGFRDLGGVLDLDVIDLPAAVRLLRSRVPDLNPAPAEEIAELLGRLPLALEQAAAYLDRTRMPPADYLRLLTTRPDTMIAEGTGKTTVATVWTLTLDAIATEDPAAHQLLDILAYLAPESIPLDLFTDQPDELPEPLATAAKDLLAFSKTLATLIDYSLVKRTATTVQLHRLVQAAIRARHSDLESIVVALRLLMSAVPAEIIDAYDNWPRWAALLPHVLSAVDHFDRGTGGVPTETTAWLMDRAGAYLQSQGRPEEARILVERALAQADSLDPNHPLVGVFASNLSLIRCALGDAEGARPLAERAVRIVENEFGSDDPRLAAALDNLSWIVSDLGELTEARTLTERALSIDEIAYGPGHPLVALRLSNLSVLLAKLGDEPGALRLAQRALASAETSYGPDHPVLANHLTNVSEALRRLGKSADALPLAERALTIAEAGYRTDHPQIATVLNNLAGVWIELGDPAAARPLLRRAVEITEAAYGPDHPQTRLFRSNLAGLGE